jgi:hypothetical protein
MKMNYFQSCIWKYYYKKHVILTSKSSQEGPHLDMHKKNHPINMEESI